MADSLRSQLSKNGLMTLEELIVSQGKKLDSYLENMTPCILKRSSDTNVFISE